MAVTQTVTLVKSGATFADVAEAIETFNTDNASAALTSAISVLNTAVSEGTLTVSAELNASANGVVITRVWDDAAYTSAGGASASRPAISSSWTRTIA